MFTLEELIELKLSVNEMMARRIAYSNIEKHDKLLHKNNEYLELDRDLVVKLLKMIEVEKYNLSLN